MNVSSQLKYDVQIVSFSKGGHTTNPIMEFSLKAAHVHEIGEGPGLNFEIVILFKILGYFFISI